VIRFRGTIEYLDGSTVEFTAGTAALAAWEAYALRHGYPMGADMPPTMGALAMAHQALGIQEGFDAWRVKVSGIEMEADESPPTLREATGG
jgi:hypothetical protein